MSGDPVAFNNTSAVDICSCVYLITYQALHSPTFRPHAREFFDNLPIQTRCLIQDSEIEILDERCLNQIDDSVITIVRKVFLLSFTELGYKKNGHVGVEGVPLLYFKDNKNRFATTNNGKFTVSWWLRSADSTYDSCVYAVGPEGEIGSTNAYDMNGIRPAFCVDGKQEIYKEEGRYILK